MKSTKNLQIVFPPFLLLLAHLYLIVATVASRPPMFVSCPDDTIRGSHCDTLECNVQAIDLDPPWMGRGIRYILIDGPGKVNSRTGEWTFSPSGEDAGNTFQVEIAACDGEIMTNGAQNCRFGIFVDPNYAPRVSLDTYECGSSFDLNAPGEKFVPLYAYDLDRCDQVTTFIQSVTPAPAGQINLGSSWGLTFVADSLDADKTFLMIVAATDGIDTTYCEITFVTHSIEPYCVRIEKTHDTYQGMHEYVDVTLESVFGPLGGFDFLLIFDRSALYFHRAISGPLFDESDSGGCGWEYFTYRWWYWPSWESHGFWAAAVIVVSMAELNNGPYHPSCFLPDTLPAVLFTLDFVVTDNRQFECQFVPIRFYWMHCHDNVLSSRSGDSLFMSWLVYDTGKVVISQEDTLPTYFGAPSECLDDPYPRFQRIRLIDFYNGGVEIICPCPDIDMTGDINLSGTPYEIADMVLFTNYFIHGLSVFHINMQGQIAATDMNHDGVTLDIADLVYGVRVIVGNALPYDSVMIPSPFTARFIQDFETKTIVVDTPDTLGAAYLVFEGNVWLSQRLPNMDIKYSYNSDDGVTRFLIYSLEGQSFAREPLISYGGDGVLIEASTATYQGRRVETRIDRRGSPGYPSEYLPTSFTLYQNYPNPFNNTTSIRFDLSHDNHVEFQVMNILGQVVYSLRKHYLAGWHQIDWNGTNNSGSPVASGIYYYRIKTAEFSDSKKMVLLK